MPINSRARIDNLVPEALPDVSVVVIVVPVVIVPIVVVIVVPVVIIPILIVIVVIPVVVVFDVDRGSGSYGMARWGRLRFRVRSGVCRRRGCLGRSWGWGWRGSRLVSVFYDRAEVAIFGAGHDILDDKAPGDDHCQGRHHPGQSGRNDARHASIMTQRNETQMRTRRLYGVGDPLLRLLGVGGVEDANVYARNQFFGQLGTTFQPLLIGEHRDLLEMVQRAEVLDAEFRILVDSTTG